MSSLPEHAQTARCGAPLVPKPAQGRIFSSRRSVRLGDADPSGRLRLDSVARYLQDVASDDVADAGWRADEHAWLVRRSEIQVLRPVRFDEQLQLVTWASGAGSSSAARRTTLSGDRGGLIEAESVWIHLDRSHRPARLSERFSGDYAPSTGGRRITPRLELPDPPPESASLPWPLRVTDADVLGHVNNAAYWEGVEELLARTGRGSGSLAAVLEFRQPVDPEEEVVLRYAASPEGLLLGFASGDAFKAVGLLRLPP